MTDDQKHAYRHAQRDRIMAMSEADRSKMKADLDARWNALPADQKADMTAKMQAFRAAHEARDGDK
jgi:GH25 family lysozyme M1 (1,4-beta-N-acetylmuramidase)